MVENQCGHPTECIQDGKCGWCESNQAAAAERQVLIRQADELRDKIQALKEKCDQAKLDATAEVEKAREMTLEQFGELLAKISEANNRKKIAYLVERIDIVETEHAKFSDWTKEQLKRASKAIRELRRAESEN